MNYFCDHGKNSRDTHFSQISKFVNSQQTIISALNSSAEIVDAILEQQRKANENNETSNFFF
jgi:hypothetical protein